MSLQLIWGIQGPTDQSRAPPPLCTIQTYRNSMDFVNFNTSDNPSSSPCTEEYKEYQEAEAIWWTRKRSINKLGNILLNNNAIEVGITGCFIKMHKLTEKSTELTMVGTGFSFHCITWLETLSYFVFCLYFLWSTNEPFKCISDE